MIRSFSRWRLSSALLAAAVAFAGAWLLWYPRPRLTLVGSEAHRPVEFSEDGKLLMTSVPASIRGVWNVAAGEPMKPFPSLDEHPFYLAPVKRLAVQDMDENLVLRDVTPGSNQLIAVRSWSDTCRKCLAFSADGRFLVSRESEWIAPFSPVLVLRKVATGERREIAGSQAVESIVACRFSPDGQILAVLSTDGLIEFWSTATGKRLFRFELDGAAGCRCFRISPDLRCIVGLALPDGPAGARLWSLSADGVRFEGRTMPANYRFASAWFTDTGQAYALTKFSRPTTWLEQLLLGMSAQRTELVIRDLDAGGKEVLRLPGCVDGVPSPDGRLVAVEKQQAGGIELWEVTPRLSVASAFTLAVLAGILAGVCVWCLAGWRRLRLTWPSLAYTRRA